MDVLFFIMLPAFDQDTYIRLQRASVLQKIKTFGDTLYLEFGGKLFDDYHAARVLPGFDPHLKIALLESLQEDTEIIFTISTEDIEKNKIRTDTGITYDLELLKNIEKLRKRGLDIHGVVVTKFNHQKKVVSFINKLKSHKITVYKHYYIENYPFDVDGILSEKGFGKNDYIQTTKPVVVVTAPGANSGKLSVCLSQLYNDKKRNIQSGYAKFETFPVWNLPLKHPVNIAYEAATADIDDVNMLDNYHLEHYNTPAISYNRDLAMFPIVKKILDSIFEREVYKSPTDMGVNMVGTCILDECAVVEACKDEILRRYLHAKVDYKIGIANESSVKKLAMLVDSLDIDISRREVVAASLRKSRSCKTSVMAIQLADGKIITGKSSHLMTAPAAMILNALKYLSNIHDDIFLLSANVLTPLLNFKKEVFTSDVLTLNEVLIALNISAQTNAVVEHALAKLDCLKDLDAHSTSILNLLDQKILKNMRIYFTSEDVFDADNLWDVD